MKNLLRKVTKFCKEVEEKVLYVDQKTLYVIVRKGRKVLYVRPREKIIRASNKNSSRV